MKHIYKSKIRIILFYTLCSMVISSVTYFIVFELTKNKQLSIVMGFISFFLYFFFLIMPSIITIEIDDDNLTVKKWTKKLTFPFDISLFKAETIKSGNYKDFSIYVIQEDKAELIYCKFIGYKDFQKILIDLGLKDNRSLKEIKSLVKNTRKNKLNKLFEDNPNAVKIFIDFKSNSLSKIFKKTEIYLVDEKPPIFFKEHGKKGFYVKSGEHLVESSFKKWRPGILSLKVTTTYGPSKQILETKAFRTYNNFFNPKDKLYYLEVIN